MDWSPYSTRMKCSLAFINRGHDYACFKEAVAMTADRGIKIGAHIILGFPTESREEMLAMADELSHQRIEFLKIHQLQVIRDTALADQYAGGKFHTFGFLEYIELVADFLERLSPAIVIQRLFAAAPEEILIAPVWDKTRSEFLLELDGFMEARGSFQGRLRSSTR